MAEVLTQSIDAKAAKKPERSVETHRTGVLHPASFKYYIHDSVATLRFQLIGDVQSHNVKELSGSWDTARTTLRGRRFLLDVTQVYSCDTTAREWFRTMKDNGAEFIPGNYLDVLGLDVLGLDVRGENSAIGTTAELTASVKLSILGRVMGLLRRGNR